MQRVSPHLHVGDRSCDTLAKITVILLPFRTATVGHYLTYALLFILSSFVGLLFITSLKLV